MASVANRVYPNAEYQEYRANTFRGTRFTGSQFSGSDVYGRLITAEGPTLSGSSFDVKGAQVITGFTAQGTIHKYQPLVFATNTGSQQMVSGSTAWGQGEIIGVSTARFTEGQAVKILVKGLVPFVTSGAGAITRGAAVIHSASGSITGSAGLPTIESFDTGTATSGSLCIIGLAVVTGAAAAAAVTQVWINPMFF